MSLSLCFSPYPPSLGDPSVKRLMTLPCPHYCKMYKVYNPNVLTTSALFLQSPLSPSHFTILSFDSCPSGRWGRLASILSGLNHLIETRNADNGSKASVLLRRIYSVKINELAHHTYLWLTAGTKASILFYHWVLLHPIHKVALGCSPQPFRNTRLNSHINSTFIVSK